MSGVVAVMRSSHPGPTLTVTVLAVVLGLAVGLDGSRLIVVAIAVLAGQLAIGWSNDLIDADRDRRVGRRDKPIAQGAVRVPIVRALVVIAGVVGVVLPFTLSLAGGLAHLSLVASGLAYNAGLKSTPASVVPFVVAFGALPAVVTLSTAPPSDPAPWAIGVGAVFGVAIHFTNVLPDLADDARTGVVGLPHRLGRVRAGLVAFAALAAGALLSLAGQTLWRGESAPGASALLAVAGASVVVGIAVVGAVAVLRGGSTRVLFRLIMLAALLLVAQLAVGGAALTV
jgi:4-hydroxybenzoate polyprenyltransferase